MKERTKTILIIVLLAAAAATLIVFEYANIRVCVDDKTNSLWLDVIPRFVTGGAALVIVGLAGYGKLLVPERRGMAGAALWCLPCLAVAVVNFPFSALCNGSAVIERTDLVWLFALKCLSIGLMEEALFRGILFSVIFERWENRKRGAFYAVFLSSAVFALYHLFNLLAGAGVGATLLQVGYSFLTGAMFAAVLLRTRNLWVCVFLHALFDFGGLLVSELGSGAFQDGIFWGLTAFFGVICFAHVLFFLLAPKKKEQEEDEPSN